MPRRAAKYRRISSDREGQALGVERQGEDLDDLGKRRGLVWAGDYVDNDISASTKSRKRRPAYTQMLKDAEAGKFEVIAAYTTGRITRRPREFEDLIDLAVQHGIEFMYVRSPEFDLATAQGRRIARTLAAQDAGEAEEIAERVRRQKRQAATKGAYRGGRRPYGYEADGATVRPSEATELLKMSHAVLKGTSLRALAADLNARRLITSTGKPWRQDTVRRVLLRARNAGLIEYTNDDGTIEILGKAQWSAIVPERIWRGVVAVLEDPARRTQFSSVRKWLGSGLYRCGVCDDGTTVRATRSAPGRPGSRIAYMCRKSKHIARTAEEVDQHITALVIARLQQPDAADLLVKDAGPDTVELHTQAAALRAQLDELAALYANHTLTASQLTTATGLLRRQLEDVEQQITDATRGSVFDGVIGAPDMERAVRDLHLDRFRAIISALMTVTLERTGRGRPVGWKPGTSYFNPESVRITWKD